MIVQLQVLHSGSVIERMSLDSPSLRQYEDARQEITRHLSESDELRTCMEDSQFFWWQEELGKIERTELPDVELPPNVASTAVSEQHPVMEFFATKRKPVRITTRVRVEFAKRVNDQLDMRLAHKVCRCRLCTAGTIIAAQGDSRG